MAINQPTPQQLLAGLVTTTLFEAAGLFSGAILMAVSQTLQAPALGVVGLLVWFLALWAENYSVAELAQTRFNLSRPLSILAMSAAEWITWALWLALVLLSDLPGLLLWVILIILTQLHHTLQFGFFYPSSRLSVGLLSPVLWLASSIEALAGQWLIVQVVTGTDLTFTALAGPLVGLLILFAVEHMVSGQVKP